MTTLSNGPPPPEIPHWGRGDVPVSQGELVAALTQLWDYVSKSDLQHRIARIERHIVAIEHQQTIQGEKIMASQADIDAVTAALVAEDSALNTAVASLTAADTAIQAEIDALKVANPALDLTALQAEAASSATASAAVAAAVAAIAALAPAPVAPPDTP